MAVENVKQVFGLETLPLELTLLSRKNLSQTIIWMTELPIDMTKAFPIGYIHRARLGITKGMLLLWTKTGTGAVRMAVRHTNEFSTVADCSP